MFKNHSREIEALERRLESLESASKSLLAQWETAQIDLSDIKQQVLRTLNRLIAQERSRKSRENGPGQVIEEPRPPNPLALGILQRRRS